MFSTITTRFLVKAGLLLCCASVMAQTPAPTPQRPLPPVRTAGQRRSAPQVVTIVHRLNALKMFRLLARSEQQAQAIAGLDSAFNLLDDVHTSVSAGVAMDDGETIAAWLPDADVEFGPPAFPPQSGFDVKVPTTPGTPTVDFKERFVDTPDVSVMGPDGKQLVARYVGFDATTGLSILKLTRKGLFPTVATKNESLGVGENVLLFGPEPVMRAPATETNSLYVRIAAIEVRIQNVLSAPSGEVARLKVSAAKLSQANIGGVAVNDAGETIGIVDGLEGNVATVLPTAAIRRAAQRVLEQQASVPRPWLGVKGEAVATLKLDQIQSQGWTMDRATELADKHRGIMLTSVVPDSPAATADLRPGDVILTVNDKEIKKAEDFTWWLDQAGPSNFVRFTVARPDRVSEEALKVKLSGSLDPAGGWLNFRNRLAQTKGLSLLQHGIETIALRPGVATQLGTTAGLLVVYVEPATPAFEAGLKPGDVIQSIDGKPLAALNGAASVTTISTLDVVRKKEKLTITLANPVKNE